MHTCFIIYPLSKSPGYTVAHFKKVLRLLCVPAVKKIGLKPVPCDTPIGIDIEDKILKQLREADLVLCDISGLNANVLYELGIRSAYGKPSALIKDRRTTAPFDLTMVQHYEYSPTRVFKTPKRAVAELVGHLKNALDEPMGKKFAAPPRGRRPGDELLKGAAACGITRIFPSRKEAGAEVAAAAEGASRRLWLLGVGLSGNFSLTDPRLKSIEKRIEQSREGRKKFDVKILLLDALTSTGVFRTLLECGAKEAGPLLDADRGFGGGGPRHPYFRQQLYRSFDYALRQVEAYPDIEAGIRFYAHTPSCWLVIADETAYFEPYTFGRFPDPPGEDSPLGPLMPVFRLDGRANAPTFKILESHFDKLWRTTNTDVFYVRARGAEEGATLREVFAARHHWLRQVNAVLYGPHGERRKHPRRRCQSQLTVRAAKEPRRGAAGQPRLEPIEVINFSGDGLRVRMRVPELKKGDRVRLEVKTPPSRGKLRRREKAGDYVKQVLVDPCGGRFRVVYTEDERDSLVVGLQPDKRKAPARRPRGKAAPRAGGAGAAG